MTAAVKFQSSHHMERNFTDLDYNFFRPADFGPALAVFDVLTGSLATYIPDGEAFTGCASFTLLADAFGFGLPREAAWETAYFLARCPEFEC